MIWFRIKLARDKCGNQFWRNCTEAALYKGMEPGRMHGDMCFSSFQDLNLAQEGMCRTEECQEWESFAVPVSFGARQYM